MERYGYSHHYVIWGLDRLLSIEDRAGAKREIEGAIARHARRVRDVPPYNHQMESYLSSLSTLVAGYNLTEDARMLREMKKRLEILKLDPLGVPIVAGARQADLAAAIEKASHLPGDPTRLNGHALWAATNGLRVFGWTHAFTLPYALKTLEEIELRNRPPLKKPTSSR